MTGVQTCALPIFGRAAIGKGGKVKDEAAIDRALDEIATSAAANGFCELGRMESPVLGAKAGNREWLVWLGG